MVLKYLQTNYQNIYELIELIELYSIKSMDATTLRSSLLAHIVMDPVFPYEDAPVYAS